jgi:hypothetical protein
MAFRLTISALILLAFTSKSGKVLSGRIYSTDNPQHYSVENIFVILRSNNIAFDTVRTNDNGQFSATIPESKQNNIDVLYSGIGFGTVYLQHIRRLDDDTTNLQIDLAARYKKNIFGIVICPKCRRPDQVYKIHYGDAPVYTVRTDDNGNKTYSPFHNGVYQAGTCVSTAQSARWYCDRDQIEF